MPNGIYIFETVEEAREILFNFNEHFVYPQHAGQNNNSIVERSVSGNVFRSFRDIDRPSTIYRSWANENFNTITNKLSEITGMPEYDDFIDELSSTLLRQWFEQAGTKLGYGPSTKMVNLLIKVIIEQGQYHQQRLIPFLHIPFDKYTLQPLRNIINDLTDIDYRINITQTATMQFVNTKELYVILLKAIRNLSNISGIEPIIYEYWGWNDRH